MPPIPISYADTSYKHTDVHGSMGAYRCVGGNSDIQGASKHKATLCTRQNTFQMSVSTLVVKNSCCNLLYMGTPNMQTGKLEA